MIQNGNEPDGTLKGLTVVLEGLGVVDDVVVVDEEPQNVVAYGEIEGVVEGNEVLVVPRRA